MNAERTGTGTGYKTDRGPDRRVAAFLAWLREEEVTDVLRSLYHSVDEGP